jgi:superoxide reductase
MQEFRELYQSADWKTEKHVPVIECPDQVKADEFFEIRASIGKEVAHPNTTEHHIRWIELLFKPEGRGQRTDSSVEAAYLPQSGRVGHSACRR